MSSRDRILLSLGACAALMPARAYAQVSGTVVSSETGGPIADAKVSLQASATETRTNSAGSFELPQVSGTGLVITAAARGFYTAGLTTTTTNGPAVLSLLLDPIAEDTNPDHELRPPWSCAMMCHAEQLEHWTNSPMALAGQNTWVFDMYDGSGSSGGANGFVYTRDSHLKDLSPASECASCHQPARWISQPFRALEPLSQNPSDEVLHGVSCEICHKVADVDESKMDEPGFFGGKARLSRPALGVEVMYGLLGDVTFQRPAQMRSAYNPDLAAKVCGICHQDKTDPNQDGDFSDGVESEGTYREWLGSSYSDPRSPNFKTCVDCHMVPIGSPEACSVLGNTISRPLTDVRAHLITGTSPRDLEHAVSLAVSATAAVDGIHVEVRVTNDQTGHAVPSGMSIRNLVLKVGAELDGMPLELLDGALVGDLGGAGDPRQGNFATLPGKVYAKVFEDSNGNAPVFFTEASRIRADTRLRPFETDFVRFVFKRPASGGEVEVSASLIYRRAFRTLTVAKGWITDGHGQPLEDVIAPDYGHLMERSTAALDLEPEALPDAGSRDATTSADAAVRSDAGQTENPTDEGCSCREVARPRSSLAWLAMMLAVLMRRKSK